MGEPWEDEGNISGVPLRILTVDVQRDSFYVVVRSWAMNGSSRLMHCAHVLTWDDIINIQMQFGVHANLCFIDCGYSTYEVYSHCADNGWTALMGDKRNTFTHRRNNAKPVERFYSPKRQINLGCTKTGLKVCDMFFWSNLNVKDALNRLRRNEEAPTWEVPCNAPQEYLDMLDSEYRTMDHGRWIWRQIGTRPNHYLDCEAMSVCAAIMLKLVGGESVSEETTHNLSVFGCLIIKLYRYIELLIAYSNSIDIIYIDMLQKLKLKDGTEITFKQRNYDVEKKEIELSIPYTKNNNRFIEQINNESNLYKENISIQFEWNNQQFNAYLFSGVVKSLEKEGDEWVHYVIFQVYDVKCKEDIPDECRLLFFIPHLNFYMLETTSLHHGGWRRDKTSFEYNRRQWLFREAFFLDNLKQIPYPYDVEKENNKCRAGVFLEFSINKQCNLNAIIKEATGICFLTSLAEGRHAYWQTLWCEKDGFIKLIEYSNFHSCTAEKKAALVVGNEFNVSNPCQFIHDAAKEFRFDVDWWKKTIIWYVNARLCENIEIKELINVMLLDRITNKVFSIIVDQSLNLKLRDYPIGEKFKNKIAIPFKKIIKNARKRKPSGEDKTFITLCSSWISDPSYKGKIKAVLSYIGVSISNAEIETLSYRNSLVHEGEIGKTKLPISKIMEFDAIATKYCHLLILSLLNYSNLVNCARKHYRINKEAANWERLKLTLLKNKAKKLLF